MSPEDLQILLALERPIIENKGTAFRSVAWCNVFTMQIIINKSDTSRTVSMAICAEAQNANLFLLDYNRKFPKHSINNSRFV
jgi:hypothetical protein